MVYRYNMFNQFIQGPYIVVIPAIIVYFAFHLSNHFLFTIGIFPWLTMFATLLFLDPEWPKQLIRWFSGHANRRELRSVEASDE